MHLHEDVCTHVLHEQNEEKEEEEWDGRRSSELQTRILIWKSLMDENQLSQGLAHREPTGSRTAQSHLLGAALREAARRGGFLHTKVWGL